MVAISSVLCREFTFSFSPSSSVSESRGAGRLYGPQSEQWWGPEKPCTGPGGWECKYVCVSVALAWHKCVLWEVQIAKQK